MQQLSRTDIAIAGGGMVGLTLALALARAGAQVALIERGRLQAQLEESFDGRVSAVASGSQRVLAAVGAWEGMAPYGEPIRDIRVSDADSPFFLHYDHREIGDAPFGWIVENRHIRAALMAAVAKQPAIRLLEGETIEGMKADAGGVTLALRSGESLRAALAVAADGKESQLREMAGIESFRAEYGQTALVCTIAHEYSHEGLAQERFLPAGPFAVLPMQANRSSLVWVEKSGNAPLFLALPEEELLQEIRERVGGYLGEISLAGPRFSYPLSLLHAREYTAPRLVLAGDAAHAIHPIAGQGVNLGFRDVAVLAELVENQRRLGLDIGNAEVLEAYARWRRFDNVTMLAVTDGLNRLFSNRIPPVKLVRGLGLWGISKLPPVRRFFMRHATGLTGDLPAMMRAAS